MAERLVTRDNYVSGIDDAQSSSEGLYLDEVKNVTEKVELLVADHAKAMLFRGKRRTADQLTTRARERAFAVYQQAVELVGESALDAAQKADLLMYIADSMEGHLTSDERATLATSMRMEVLPDLLGKTAYMRFGRELANGLQDGPIVLGEDYDVPKHLTTLSELPPSVRGEVIERFVDLKLLDQSEAGELKFGARRNAATYLRNGTTEVARMASRIITAELPTGRSASLDDVEARYAAHNERTAVQKVEISSKGECVKILPLNELRIGHQDGSNGLRLVRETIEYVNLLPDDEKPNVILVTNLIQGEFAHSQAGRRTSLVGGVDSNDLQFNSARLLLDELKATGIPVVLSLGRDDRRIANDNVVDIMKELRGLAKQSGQENHAAYYEVNKLQQDPRFQSHLEFQVKYAIPLSYILGRALRSKDQMIRDTEGVVTTSEELALYAHIMHGEELPQEVGIAQEVIAQISDWHDGFRIVNDFDMTLSTEERSTEIWYRHSMSGFTPETMLQNHVSGLVDMLGAMGTNGAKLPNMIMTGGQQEYVTATRSGATVVSLPGLGDPALALRRDQLYSTVPGDNSRRFNLLRKRPSSPSVALVEQWDTGESAFSYISKDLMDRADSLPRTAVFELCDFQLGSPTARPDYQIKYLSYMLEIAKHMPIAIQFAGDIIHGHIYPGFSDESQFVGLIKIESQKLMMTAMLRKAFWAVPESLLNNIVDVLVQQGNHDEIQKKRVPNNNDTNIDYIINNLQWLLGEEPDQEDTRVRHNSIFYTETGVPVPTWAGYSQYGAYNFRTAHYHMLKMGKGAGGGLPVYDAYKRAVGLGDEENSNIFMGAHWHNPQSAVLGDKLVVVGGAMAEQSQFEDSLGYSARLAGTVVMIGGGKPPKVVTVGAEALDRHGVRNGWFTPENLADHGYHDDPGFDVRRHGMYTPNGTPRSGLQKALHDIARKASMLDEHRAVREPNLYDGDGNPIKLNPQTKRIMAREATKLSGIAI